MLKKMRVWIYVALVFCFCCIANTKEAWSAGKNPMWVISSEQNSIYILGSVHMLRSEDYPLDEAIESAFSDCQVLVLEMDMGNARNAGLQQIALKKGMLAPGDSLEKKISKETYKLAKAKAAELGIDISIFNQFKPWFFTMTLTMARLQALGFSPQHGLDLHFFKKAEQSGKRVIGLETFEQQLKMLDTLSNLNQDDLLLQTIDQMDKMEVEFDELIDAWTNGNIKVLEEIMLKSFKSYPKIYTVIITQRNENWISKIESYMKRKDNYMVVIGFAHLAGSQGVIEMLRKRGYLVEQL